MTELLMQKLEDSLHPTDSDGYASMRQVPEHSLVRVKFSVPRNVRQLRLFFELINVVFEHQREPRQFATRDALREAITVAVGHCHQVTNLIDGKVYIVPNSISFGSMDQVAWREFFDAAKRLIVETIVPGVGSRDLDQAIADRLREHGPDQLQRCL